MIKPPLFLVGIGIGALAAFYASQPPSDPDEANYRTRWHMLAHRLANYNFVRGTFVVVQGQDSFRVEGSMCTHCGFIECDNVQQIREGLEDGVLVTDVNLRDNLVPWSLLSTYKITDARRDLKYTTTSLSGVPGGKAL